MSEGNGREGGDLRLRRGPLRRTLDLCIVAPVGIAATVVEELPELIGEGRRRVELQLGNALVVGRFVVRKKQRDLSRAPRRPPGQRVAPRRRRAATSTADPPAPAAGPQRPAPDPAAAVIVGRALADYDTLSASQVVRRLESLGPEELQAVQRYEASTRNRRTILNRAGQLLDERLGGPQGP